MAHLFFPDLPGMTGLVATVIGGAESIGSDPAVPATLRGYRLAIGDGDRFPALALAPAPGAAVKGRLLALSGDVPESRLAYFAAATGRRLSRAEVESRGLPVPALMLEGAPGNGGAPGWDADWAAIWTEAAAEIMSDFATRDADDSVRWLQMILDRAWSRVQAGRSTRRSPGGFTGRDVTVSAFRRPYSAFFAVEEYSLSHRLFDGSESGRVNRAVFIASDAVTLLPYDPRRDRVLLVEQIRMAPLARGEDAPWILEPVAGRIDAGQTPEQTAHREAEEEAGLTLRRLEKVAEFYPSTGCFSEYVYSYVGIAELPDDAAGLGGLDHEGEDIRAHVMDRERMMQLIAAGAIPDAPALISAYWLQANLDKLRSAG